MSKEKTDFYDVKMNICRKILDERYKECDKFGHQKLNNDGSYCSYCYRSVYEGEYVDCKDYIDLSLLFSSVDKGFEEDEKIEGLFKLKEELKDSGELEKKLKKKFI